MSLEIAKQKFVMDVASDRYACRAVIVPQLNQIKRAMNAATILPVCGVGVAIVALICGGGAYWAGAGMAPSLLLVGIPRMARSARASNRELLESERRASAATARALAAQSWNEFDRVAKEYGAAGGKGSRPPGVVKEPRATAFVGRTGGMSPRVGRLAGKVPAWPTTQSPEEF